RLDGVEPAVHADAHAIILAAASLPMNAQAAHHLRKLLVVGEHRAAVAVAAQRLGGKETRRGCRRERTEAAILVSRAEGLGGVVEHEELLRRGDRGNAIVVRGLPEEIHRDHGPGPKAKLARRRAGALRAL